MRIAQVAPVAEAVPPEKYGGTERVVSWLTEELVRRGHDVTLFAAGSSRTSATLVPVVPRALRQGDHCYDTVSWQPLEEALVEERADEFDIIHSHIDEFAVAMLNRGVITPMVTTLHGRLDREDVQQLLADDRMPAVSISYAQRDPVPSASWAANVYHGLPLDRYRPGPGDGDYLVFLGRMSPEKRPDVAIDVARRAGVRLVMAAKVDAADRRYFEEVVRPHLSDPLVDFVGEVDEPAKGRLLRHARALLFPILWPEPFGLVMTEALAYGTPVITRRCGSTPEVVAHGRVGYVCDDDDSLVDAVRQVGRIDRTDCRRWVEEHFSVERMTANYERVFETLTTDHTDSPSVTTSLAPQAA
jgi:glycosyltransferase involved in cell wall biosynthesis